MADLIVLQFDPTPVPVRVYAEKWGKDPDTLAEWCRRGWIEGAYKHPSGEWWVMPIKLCNLNEQTIIVLENRYEQEGVGNSSGDGRSILRPVDSERRARVRRKGA